MKPHCHICNTQADFLVKKDGFDEYLCPECGLSFVYPQPKAEWLKDEVYSYESGYQANKKQNLEEMPRERVVEKVTAKLAEVKPGGKLLDVGCSSGHFLHVARKAGLKGQGVEINKRTTDIARSNGFEVFNGFLEDAPFEKESFDAIFLGDVIEHVTDPRNVVGQCRELLKPDGVLVISTPNMDCFWSKATFFLFRAFGIPWSSLTPPHHLFQFSISNMNQLFKEEELVPVYSFYSYPPSLKYELGSLHLYRSYKEKKSLGTLFFMLFSYALYAIIFGINILFRPFLTRDFRMIVFYKSSEAETKVSVQ